MRIEEMDEGKKRIVSLAPDPLECLIKHGVALSLVCLADGGRVTRGVEIIEVGLEALGDSPA